MARSAKPASPRLDAPGPFFTPWAAWFFATRLALPVLLLAAVLDVAVWGLTSAAGAPCLSLVCWWTD
jgi:hypothetical protein